MARKTKITGGMAVNKVDALHISMDMVEDRTDRIMSKKQMDFPRELFPEDYEPELYDVTASFSIDIEVKEKKRA